MIGTGTAPSTDFTTSLTFLLPFVAFVPTEEVGGSGVLAVVVAGLVLGFTVLLFRQPIVNGLEYFMGVTLWDPQIRFLTELPAKVDPVDVIGIAGMAMGMSFLATLYPAWRAANTDPVEVLRYE